MIKFFRKIRQNLLMENKTGKYFKYAIGEIVLVVIGILIALSINNWNDQRKERAKELHYLQNIKTDLQLNKAELNKFLATRKNLIGNAQKIIAHFEGKPVTDLAAFNQLCIPIFAWKRYYQNNNTFQELLNSGNLALITNDSIKTTLLNMEMEYKKLKSEEAHYRFDMETTIYQPIYQFMDVQALTDNFAYRVSQGQAGRDVTLPKQQFDVFFNTMAIKNGFTFTILEYEILNQHMDNMISMTDKLIALIDQELNTK